MNKSKSKISILTKVEKSKADYPDIIKINTLEEVEPDESSADEPVKNNNSPNYFLMTETGEEIKGNYSHIIKLYNLLGGTIIKESDYSNFIKPITNKDMPIYKVFQEHFYAGISS